MRSVSQECNNMDYIKDVNQKYIAATIMHMTDMSLNHMPAPDRDQLNISTQLSRSTSSYIASVHCYRLTKSEA